jgi:hypothetical protein
MATLLELAGAAPRQSAHALLFQAGAGHRSVRAAAARTVGAPVGTWIEVAGTGAAEGALLAVTDALAAGPVAGGGRCLGLIFGTRSAAVGTAPDARAILAAERTWEEDVAAACRKAGSEAPAANVCVYREADLRRMQGDPLAVALGLIRAHPHVGMQDRRGAVMTGPAAIEAILSPLRPSEVAPEVWASLAAAAAIGLHRETAAA